MSYPRTAVKTWRRRVLVVVTLMLGGLALIVDQTPIYRPIRLMTFASFRHQQFALSLPLVPQTMVAAPPESHIQAPLAVSDWPRGLRYALYRQAAKADGIPPARHPSAEAMARILPDFGPARVYRMSHDLATYWAYGDWLDRAGDRVALDWVPYLFRMERIHRPYPAVRGVLSVPPKPPAVVPSKNQWLVVAYQPYMNQKQLPYLSGIDLVIHEDTVWIFFRGEPKDRAELSAPVPTSLVPPPSGVASVPAQQIAPDLTQHFAGLDPDVRIPGKPRDLRLYHGARDALMAWMTDQAQRLDTPALGYTDYTGLLNWGGATWAILSFSRIKTNRPETTLWMVVTQQGWAALGVATALELPPNYPNYGAVLHSVGTALASRSLVPVYLPKAICLTGVCRQMALGVGCSLDPAGYELSLAGPGLGLTENQILNMSGGADDIGSVWGIANTAKALAKARVSVPAIASPANQPIRNLKVAAGITAQIEQMNQLGFDQIVWHQDGWQIALAGGGIPRTEMAGMAEQIAQSLDGLRLPGQDGEAIFSVGSDAPSSATYVIGHTRYVIQTTGWSAATWASQMTRVESG